MESSTSYGNLLTTRDLKKHYLVGSVRNDVLRGIYLQINRGEFVGLKGPSGSGKSTLLYQLGLLDTPDEGEIIFDGVKTSLMDHHQRQVTRLTKMGFIFQNYALLPELSTLENVMLPGLSCGKDRSHVESRARQIIELVGLIGKMHDTPDHLSGGEQQRVSIARSIINQPTILFADEPCANLDTVSSKKVMDVLKHLNEHFGLTILMVSHDLSNFSYASRIIEVVDGLVVNRMK
ncbi:ABC transporter ATP-binding protein [Candidatus Woesearchaeota archaeon]|nr:ABC transporter ATP-binding protein [Candidatus Woesearchaeota archaeon]